MHAKHALQAAGSTSASLPSLLAPGASTIFRASKPQPLTHLPQPTHLARSIRIGASAMSLHQPFLFEECRYRFRGPVTIAAGVDLPDIIGSSWDKKLPKDEIMLALAKELKLEGKSILVTGDGRSEISAGLTLGALTISRLNPDAARQRELHESLGTHIMVEDFDDPLLEKVFRKV